MDIYVHTGGRWTRGKRFYRYVGGEWVEITKEEAVAMFYTNQKYYRRVLRGLLLMLLLAVAIGLATGCGSSATEPEQPEEELCEYTHPDGEIVCAPAPLPLQ